MGTEDLGTEVGLPQLVAEAEPHEGFVAKPQTTDIQTQ